MSSNDNGLGGVNIIVHASSAILLGCGLEPRSNDLVRNIKEQVQQLVGSHDNVPFVGNISRPYPLYHLYLVASKLSLVPITIPPPLYLYDLLFVGLVYGV